MLIPIRDENRKKTIPIFTFLILLANVAVFIYQLLLGEGAEKFIFRFGAIPWELTHFQELPDIPADYHTTIPNFLTLFTSMFMHGGFLHIIGNMLYLWIFADNVEAVTGHLKFPVFYLFCGLAAAMTHVFFSPNSSVPMVGASGAISGILGAYMIKFPRARVHLLFWFIILIHVIRVPALLVLGLWFVFQIFNGMGSLGMTESGGGVAWFAHIGGFVAGMVLIQYFEK